MAKGARFFARLRAAALECPGGCGRLYDLRATRAAGDGRPNLTRRYWDPLSGRFECPGCGAVAQLGVIAYRLPTGRGAIPEDWRPNLQQALWLRDHTRGKDGGKIVLQEQGANVVEGADFEDVAQLGGAVPALEAPRGRAPLNEPGKRSPVEAPTYGSTWRQQRRQAQQQQEGDGGDDEQRDDDDAVD